MFEAIFGSAGAEKVLSYLEAYGEGYASEIARTFEVSLVSVQNQLLKFENAGILVSRMVGRTRVYSWNPRFVLLDPLRALLKAAIQEYPDRYIKKHFRKRTRPRRPGKRL